MSTTTWTVYIIRTKTEKLYTGITIDLNRRLEEHQKKRVGARFFHFSAPESVVYQESCPSRSEASKRESEIKKMTRTQKLELIKKRSGFRT